MHLRIGFSSERSQPFSGRFLLLAALLLLSSISLAQAQTKLKVGFIYTGLVDDHGWDASLDEGRLAIEKEVPGVETSYVESVAEGDLESDIDAMIGQGIKVIFTTSPTYMDGTMAEAARHADVIFFNADGYKQAPNVGTYLADLYQCSYLMGMAAGGLSKSGKIGLVTTYPTPENVRNTDAYLLGIRAANPKAILNVRWLNSWFDPPAAIEATQALLQQGFDVLNNGMDCPTVEEVAEAHHLPVSGMSDNGDKIAPHSLVTACHYDWKPSSVSLIKQIQSGAITPHSLQNFDPWWRLSSHAVQMYYQPGVLLNPGYKSALAAVLVDDGAGHKISLYDLILKRYDQMCADPPQFEPFTGPLVDADGKVRVAAGQTASKVELYSMTWKLPGITGSWPK